MTIEFKSEKFIEDYVCEKLKEDNVCIISNEGCEQFNRQVNLGSYGIADIIKMRIHYDYIIVDGSVDKVEVEEVEFTILELKNTLLEECHLSQVLKYKKGLGLCLASMNFPFPYSIKCQLAGLKNLNSDFIYLAESLDVDCYFIGVTMESGFTSESIGDGYRMKKEHFPKSIELVESAIDIIDIETSETSYE